MVSSMRELDPKVFGPGTWTVMHVLAIVCEESGTPEDHKAYCQIVHRIVHALPCSTCRKHAVQYLDDNQIPRSKDGGSLFTWSVAFHNAVNRKLKKPQMPLAEAYAIYSNTEVVLTNKETASTCTIGIASDSDSAAGGCQDASL